DKLILDTYGDTVSFKRRRDDEDKDEEPTAGSNRGSKRRQAGKELESTSALKKKTSKTSGKSYEGSKSQHKTAGESTQIEEPMHTTKDMEEPAHKDLVELEYLFEEVYKATTEQLDWNNPEGQQYPHDLRKPLPLIPNSRGRRVIPFDHFINNDLEYLSGGVLSRKYATSVTKTKAADYGTSNGLKIWSLKECGVKCRESSRDVYSKRRIIPVTKIKIVDWHNYKHLDWITIRRDDEKLYKFKEGDFKRLSFKTSKT
ncbi:hypothetical protein Tco_1130792, partial [Tanacetum coccineum]